MDVPKVNLGMDKNGKGTVHTDFETGDMAYTLFFFHKGRLMIGLK